MAKRTRLKSARLARGWSMDKVADMAGVSRAVIQSWEARTHYPRGDHAIRVAEIMGLTFDDLVHDFELQRVQRDTPKRKEKVIE
jgi:transcriptional regulator with XRE-family HTH domain